MNPMNKKGQIGQLGGLITALVAIGILIVVGFLIMSQARTQVTGIENTARGLAGESACDGITLNGSCGHGSNATHTTIDSMSDIPGWLPIIVVTVIGALLVGLVSLFRRTG